MLYFINSEHTDSLHRGHRNQESKIFFLDKKYSSEKGKSGTNNIKTGHIRICKESEKHIFKFTSSKDFLFLLYV
jgi:hypothetical protein